MKMKKKKRIVYIILVTIAMLFVACGPKVENEDNKPGIGTEKPVVDKKIGDYVKFKENEKFFYKGENMEYAEYVTYVDYTEGDKVQLRKSNGGTEMVSVLEIKDGELRQVFSRSECYYRENFLSKKGEETEVLLKEPLVKGTSWNLSDGSKRYISNENVEISTPSGTYKTLEVTTELKSGEKNVQYYALDKGLVKSVMDTEKMKVTSLLEKVEDNSKFSNSVRFYYPNIDDYSLFYKNVDMEFKTNDITKSVFENIFKSFPEENKGVLMSKNAKINSLYLNDDGMLYADFSSEFIKEMNAGSGFEAAILQSIVNTLGGYYGVEKVYLTVDGNPYNSGHILMEKGEAFTVDLSNTTEAK